MLEDKGGDEDEELDGGGDDDGDGEFEGADGGVWRDMVASTEKWSLREHPIVGWRSVMPTWTLRTSHVEFVGFAVLLPLPMKM